MSRLTDDQLQELKDRVSLVDVVRAKVPSLKKKGRSYWACCPFHQETTPSFHVREDQGFYHCFGCGAHGDAIKFVQETQGGSFMDAVRHLADKVGMKLNLSNENPAQTKQRQDGFGALTAAAGFYQGKLNSDTATYLKKRGLSAETVKEFGLGFAPDSWEALREGLTQQGFTKDVLRNTGLTLQSDKGRDDYDRFRGRLMFPIHDLQNRVVGFGGRIIGEGEPKYLNSSETPFFNKSRILFNLNRAREHIRSEDQALLVEGYMDVIGLWQQGIKTAVAACGTSVTPGQLQLLWRHHTTPTVCLDGDNAGRGAAIRTAERALSVMQAGQSLNFVFLPQGEDPDSYVQKHGAESFNKVLSQASSLESVLWQAIADGLELTKGTGRAAAEKRISELLRECKDNDLRKHLSSDFKQRLWQAGSTRKAAAPMQDHSVPSVSHNPALTVLGIICAKPGWLDDVFEQFAALTFDDPDAKALQQVLLTGICEEGLVSDELGPYLMSCGIENVANELKRHPSVAQLLDAEDAKDQFVQLCKELAQRQQEVSQQVAQLKDLEAKLTQTTTAS